ncbi:hypothetical protein CRE_18184 [Caenorhabditis remanei]|uniref:DUF38 domain-containing protein n=1 Tax=Caenorhabditis remanei TaxID=31234 RepID=E3N8L4_CAERE|nr:hypothetical protein CRE_18184 [Caenorhabditis remanei]
MAMFSCFFPKPSKNCEKYESELEPGALRFEEFFSHGHHNSIPTDPLTPFNFSNMCITGGHKILTVTYSPSGHGGCVLYFKRGNNCDVKLISYDPREMSDESNETVSQQILNDQNPFNAFLSDFEKVLSHPYVTVDSLSIMLHGDVNQQFVELMEKKLAAPIAVRALELDIKAPEHHVNLLECIHPLTLKKLTISYFGDLEDFGIKAGVLEKLPVWNNLDELHIKTFVVTEGVPDLGNFEKVSMTFDKVGVNDVVKVIETFLNTPKCKNFHFHFFHFDDADKLFDIIKLPCTEMNGLKMVHLGRPDTVDILSIMQNLKENTISLTKMDPNSEKSDRFFGF